MVPPCGKNTDIRNEFLWSPEEFSEKEKITGIFFLKQYWTSDKKSVGNNLYYIFQSFMLRSYFQISQLDFSWEDRASFRLEIYVHVYGVATKHDWVGFF